MLLIINKNALKVFFFCVIISLLGDGMDNGYSKWKENNKEVNKKRFIFFMKILPILLIILGVVFFFGYDYPLLAKEKLVEFLPGALGITLIFVIISFIKYPWKKYIMVCNKCGAEIKNVDEDCEIADITLVGTEDKTVYEKKKSKIKGKTVYPRGGYSMRVSEYEYSSEATYEVEENVPVVKKCYIYDITYSCKKCGEIFKTVQIESFEPISKKRGKR